MNLPLGDGRVLLWLLCDLTNTADPARAGQRSHSQETALPLRPARLGQVCAQASLKVHRPSAVRMSARVAFSASLTATPPNPRKPPSVEAAATFSLTWSSQSL